METIAEICKKASITAPTYYRYCKQAKKRLTVEELKEIKKKQKLGRPRKLKF